MTDYGALSMTDDELYVFLNGDIQNAHLASLRRDGSPMVTPLGYYYDGDCLYVSIAHNRTGVSRMRRDPRVAVEITSDFPVRFAIFQGLAEELPDPENVWSRKVLFRGPPDKWAKRGIDQEKFAAHWLSLGRVVFRIRPTSVTTYDQLKIEDLNSDDSAHMPGDKY
jgi:nitroimidazol reductase NimA-like FMN-containing flavoprotein (pyridoxamine 5'-phosphate oxidase superfamily)